MAEKKYAVGTFVGIGHGELGPAKERSQKIQEAMQDAVRQCYAKGITDPEKIREAISKARNNV